MTTAGQFSYAFDPSGDKLRRALLIKTAETPPTLARLAVGIASALTLAAGVLRVITS